MYINWTKWVGLSNSIVVASCLILHTTAGNGQNARLNMHIIYYMHMHIKYARIHTQFNILLMH